MACDFSAFSGLGRASISRRLQVAGNLNFRKPLFGLEGLQCCRWFQSEATPKIWKATGPSSSVLEKQIHVVYNWCILVSCASHVHQVYRRAPLQTCGPRRATRGKKHNGHSGPERLRCCTSLGWWVGTVGVDVKFPWFCAHARCYARDAAQLILPYLELPNILSFYFSGVGDVNAPWTCTHAWCYARDVTWLVVLNRFVQFALLDKMLCCDVSFYAFMFRKFWRLKPANCASPT